MAKLGFSEQAQVYKVGFIATRICTILDRIQKGREGHEKDDATLAEGADLMSQIISGSLLVEEKSAHGKLAPSLEGISVLGSALSVLRKLGSKIEEGGLTDLFMHYNSCLEDISQGKVVSDDDVVQLKDFFEMLSKLIMDDIKSQKLNFPQNQISMRFSRGNCNSCAL